MYPAKSPAPLHSNSHEARTGKRKVGSKIPRSLSCASRATGSTSSRTNPLSAPMDAPANDARDAGPTRRVPRPTDGLGPTADASPGPGTAVPPLTVPPVTLPAVNGERVEPMVAPPR